MPRQTHAPPNTPTNSPPRSVFVFGEPPSRPIRQQREQGHNNIYVGSFPTLELNEPTPYPSDFKNILSLFKHLDKNNYERLLKKYPQNFKKIIQIFINSRHFFESRNSFDNYGDSTMDFFNGIDDGIDGIRGIQTRIYRYYRDLDEKDKELISELLNNDAFLDAYKFIITPPENIEMKLREMRRMRMRYLRNFPINGGKKSRKNLKNKRKNRKTLRK